MVSRLSAAREAPQAPSAASGTLSQKTARQETVSVSAPPAKGPQTVAMPPIPRGEPRGPAAQVRGIGVGEQGQPHRYDHSSAGSLSDACGDQHGQTCGERAQQGGDSEEGQAQDEQSAAADQVAEAAGSEHEGSGGHEVGAHRPLQAVASGAEFGADAGKREVQGEGVQLDAEHPHGHGEQYPGTGKRSCRHAGVSWSLGNSPRAERGGRGVRRGRKAAKGRETARGECCRDGRLGVEKAGRGDGAQES